MHCRYFVETKTLWEYLNSPAATIQLLRPHDIACIGEKFTVMASMSSDDVMLTMLGCACDASLLTWHSRHVHPETPFFVLVALTDGH